MLPDGVDQSAPRFEGENQDGKLQDAPEEQSRLGVGKGEGEYSGPHRDLDELRQSFKVSGICLIIIFNTINLIGLAIQL